jgi:hypothetical protein
VGKQGLYRQTAIRKSNMESDVGLVVAIVGSAIGIIAVVISMFFWVRSEANNDRRRMDDVQREDRKDLLQISRNIENEIKDFHNKLAFQDMEFRSKILEIEKSRSN